MADVIELLIEPRRRPVGTGEVRRVLPFRRRRSVGPFVFADLMGPDDLGAGVGVDVDAHPHIGLSTLTYLFDGRLVHRDSIGSVQTIEPGAVNWMTAGSGVTHTERSHPDDRPVRVPLFGVQLWVALPTDREESAPHFSHTPAHDIPDERGIRLVAGSGWGAVSPVPVSSPLVLAEMTLDEHGVALDDSFPERAVLAVDGDVRVDGTTLSPGRLAVIEREARPTLSGAGRAVVLGGEPLGERFIWWNFVHSDRDRIEDAKAAWTEQRFPTVPDDHDPWVPLPG